MPPVCTTELGAVARLQPEWEKRNVKVIGLSCNTLESHEQWIADINETQNCQVRFPIIADKSRTVATLYGMLDHQDPTNIDKLGMPFTVRSVFVLGPDHEIRLTITYPASTGRNFTEILRCVDALQLTDKRRVATPADWRPGDDVVVHASVGAEEAKRLFPEHRVVKPYLRMTKLDVEKP
ncbi:hypothetical protein HK101_009457 [Irineochytrium annulatum]|nr:hypothetical protein HK101_009457 [Irineochytrium annulatum]